MDILEVVPQGRLHGIELGCDVGGKRAKRGPETIHLKYFV